jgi:hypothetical protein
VSVCRVFGARFSFPFICTQATMPDRASPYTRWIGRLSGVVIILSDHVSLYKQISVYTHV